MNRISKLIGRFTEGSLKLSSAVTSIVILLIVIFLFKEGFGLFNSPTVTKGYSLYVNAENPVEALSPYEIKKIFNSEIKNWTAVGGGNQEIRLFRFEQIFNKYSEEELGADYSL
ncbi:MAG TPA: substrate-binding domain-containing protein, partial [Chitinophagaceae bacterium]|nr:substrate-binding domain-containing protein [Chitinophagaceae bacterium]